MADKRIPAAKLKLITGIIDDIFDLHVPPEKKAARKLFDSGFRSGDLAGLKGLEDARRIATMNAMRDIERSSAGNDSEE